MIQSGQDDVTGDVESYAPFRLIHRNPNCKSRVHTSVNTDVNNIKCGSPTTLQLPVRSKDWERVEDLLQSEACVCSIDFEPLGEDKALLRDIVERRHAKLLRVLLDNGLSVEATYPVRRWSDRDLPLILLASSLGAAEIFSALVNRGAAVDPRHTRDLTCLHVACYGGHNIIVDRLLDTFAPLSTSKAEYVGRKDASLRSALFYACAAGYEDVVETLLRHGARITCELEDEDGRTCLHAACHGNHVRVATTLLENVDEALKSDLVNAGDWAERTALSHACRHGYSAVVEVLLRNGADCCAVDGEGRTCLQDACANRHYDVVTLILDNVGKLQKGDFVNKRNFHNKNAMYYACSNGSPDIVLQLLRSDADVLSTFEDGWTCLHVTSMLDHTCVVKVLLDNVDARRMSDFVNGVDVSLRSVLSYACERGNRYAVDLLLRHGADVVTQDANRTTCLHLACATGCLEIVEALLENLDSGTKLGFINARDENNVSGLHVACERGRVDVSPTLILNGSDVTLRDGEGRTCLRVAIARKRVDVVRTLLSNVNGGTKHDLLNEEDGCKHRALFYARKKAGLHSEMVRLLLEHGALSE